MTLVQLSKKISLEKYDGFLSTHLSQMGRFRKESLRSFRRYLNNIYWYAPVESGQALRSERVYKEDFQDYSDYWKELYPIQAKEFIDLTLGLDVESKTFITDATYITAKTGQQYWFLDANRHHLLGDKKENMIFQFLETGFLPNIGILTGSSHMTITNLQRRGDPTAFNMETKLAIARILHLFDMINRPYISGKIYSFKGEFISKTVTIDGEKLFLWEGMDENIMEEWTRKWIDSKTLSEEANYNKYYSDFYKYKYKPYMVDLEKYLNKDPSTNDPDFWEWYTRYYTREHNTLMSRIYNSIFFRRIMSINSLI